jgi:iron complex transport system substrate-binding protein
VKRLLLIGAALVLLPLFAIACGGGDDTENASTGAVQPTATVPAAIDLSKDDLGRSVKVPANPQRVVAMSPTVVEMVYAVGATPVGRPSSANYPEAAKSVEAFGTSYQPSLEVIASMKPDLIIADAIIHQGTIEQIASLGVPVWAVKVDSFATVVSGLEKVGALTGKLEKGQSEAKALKDKMAAVKAKLPTQQPTVLVVVAAGPGQFIASKDTSYLGNLLKELGAKNVAGSETDNFRFPGFADYSLEKIVQADPDVIIGISVGGPPGTPKTTELLGMTPGWSGLKAVKNGNVREVDHVIYLESAGPRVSQILDELPRILYPSVFASR